MTPKPLGYYGLNLQSESRIDGFDIGKLVALMSITADEIYDLYEETRSDCVGTAVLTETEMLSLPQKLSLVRAMCDRIEVKLMEVASND